MQVQAAVARSRTPGAAPASDALDPPPPCDVGAAAVPPAGAPPCAIPPSTPPRPPSAAEDSVRSWITRVQSTSASKLRPPAAGGRAADRTLPPTDARAPSSPSVASSARRVAAAPFSRSLPVLQPAGGKYAAPVLSALEGGESPPALPGLMPELLDELARNLVHELEGTDMLDEVCCDSVCGPAPCAYPRAGASVLSVCVCASERVHVRVCVRACLCTPKSTRVHVETFRSGLGGCTE